MPLCTFYSLRIILMVVLFLHASKSDNKSNFAEAAPLPSNPESRDGNIGSALLKEEGNGHSSTPVGDGPWKKVLQNTGDVEGISLLALNDNPSVPSPGNVQLAFINISSVLITWTHPSTDHTQFIVQMSYDGDPYKDVSDMLDSTEFVYSKMKYSAYYQFRVTAYINGVASPPTETNYFINGITAPPGPPTKVMAMVMSRDVINLQWDAPNTPSPLIYFVEWGTNETQLDQKETVAQSTHISFDGLEPSQTYFFRVTADINSWLSIPSPTVNKTTPPPGHVSGGVHPGSRQT